MTNKSLRTIKAPPLSMVAQSTGEGNSVCCPTCGSGKGRVQDSRPINGTIRRRRICSGCNTRFTTIEFVMPQGESVLSVNTMIAQVRDSLDTAVRRMNALQDALQDLEDFAR